MENKQKSELIIYIVITIIITAIVVYILCQDTFSLDRAYLNQLQEELTQQEELINELRSNSKDELEQTLDRLESRIDEIYAEVDDIYLEIVPGAKETSGQYKISED